MKIIYPKIKECNKYDSFYNYINEFKNKRNIVEISYLCAKEVIDKIEENKELYENCIKGLELIELWLKDKNSIDIEELIEFADSIYNSAYYSTSSIYYSAYSIYNSAYCTYCSCSAYCVYCAYKAKPEILSYIQKLTQMYLRTIKEFNIKKHNNTYCEKILKQIVNTEYNQLSCVDKNQVIDLINEFYDIEINQFDFVTYKTIKREFVV